MSEDGSTGDDADWFEEALADDEPETESESDLWAELDPDDHGDATTEHAAGGRPDAGDEPSKERASEAGNDPWNEPESVTGADSDTLAGPEADAGAESDPWAEPEPGTDGPAEAGRTAFETEADVDAGVSSAEDDVFDEDFASAFGGDGEESFEADDLDTDIPRLDLGIEGLDEMIQGGVPERHLITAIGAAGSGKTTFGLQFLHHGLEHGQPGVFITLEQTHQAILDTANEWGWDFEAYEASDDLAIVDLDPVEMANSLDNIRGELPDLIEDFGADRLVLDSVSLLEMMYDQQAKRRTEVYDFTRSLKEAGVTTFLTSEASESNAYGSRFGIIEYLTDAVFVLQYVRSESRETRLAVEIVKIRNANHSREKKPYAITDDGINVYQQANIF